LADRIGPGLVVRWSRYSAGQQNEASSQPTVLD